MHSWYGTFSTICWLPKYGRENCEWDGGDDENYSSRLVHDFARDYLPQASIVTVTVV